MLTKNQKCKFGVKIWRNRVRIWRNGVRIWRNRVNFWRKNKAKWYCRKNQEARASVIGK